MEQNDWIRNLDRIEQEELAEQKKKLKQALGIKSPSEEMAKIGQAMMDKPDMSKMSAYDVISNVFKETKWSLDKTDKEENVQDAQGKIFKMEYLGSFEESRDNHTIIDPLLKEFKDVTWAQQEKVLASGKYPHPIHKDNHTAMEWMDHQMSEFADALVYHQCLKQTIKDVHELIDYAFQKSKDDQVDALLIQALNRLRG